MGQGLPELNIYFKTAAETAIKRSSSGVAALILRDDTALGALSVPCSVYSRLADADKKDYTEESYDYISKTFLGDPGRVIVERIGIEDTLDAVLGRLKTKKWNYLAMPSATDDEAKTIAEWIAAQRAAKKTFKAVLNYEANSEGVINFATDEITVGEKVYTAAEYCVRIAGILAGMSFDDYDRASATYAKLAEVTSIAESSDADADVAAGRLILINDGSCIKIGRAVNSLAVLSDGQTEDMKKIRIIEIVDMIADDVKEAFAENYVGVYPNGYDNKLIFVNEVTQYYRRLAQNGVLETEYDNRAFIDIDGQRKWLAEKRDVSALTDEEIKTASTGSRVFVGSNIQALDAMEDLDMWVSM